MRVIITGATGMVGEGVLHECLNHPEVEKVLVVNRKPCRVVHPKLTELIHADFYNFKGLETDLSGYDACFFCLGVTSVGKNETEYYRLTYTLTMHVAEFMAASNPDMIFCYISGASTDSTEKGRMMWARVKGKTENDLMKLPFNRVYAFRPGYLHPTKGLKNTHKFYSFIGWLFPLLKLLMPGKVSTLKQLGVSMIRVVLSGYEKPVLEVCDIIRMSALP